MVRAGLTTDRVVRLGAELADEIGFEHVTPTELALLALAELADLASTAVAGLAGKDALIALANVHRDYALEHPGRFTAARFRLAPDKAVTSAGVRHAELTRAILRGYDLAEPHQTHAVRLLGSVFSGFVGLEAAGGFSHSTPGSQESWTEILDALDVLLRAWPRTK